MKQSLQLLKKYFNIILIVFGLLLATGSAVALADQNQIQVKAAIVNVRTGPSLSYDVMSKVKAGQRLDVIGQKNGWYQIRLDETKIGWVASWLVDNTEIGLNSSTKSGRINTAGVDLFQTASENGQVLATPPAGSVVTILYNSGDWTQIKYGQLVGWLKSSQLSEISQNEAHKNQPAPTNQSADLSNTMELVTNQADTKLRMQPNTAASIVTVLPAQTTLTLLKQSGNWYQARTSDGKIGYVASWVVTERAKIIPIQKPSRLSAATIVLDPGHGGADSGAVSANGKFEKTYTLKVAEMTASKLREAGANVILTRSTDQFVSLAERPQIANKANADAFISFHFDSSEAKNDASGFTTYYYRKAKDDDLATTLNKNFGNLPLTNKGIRLGDFQVLRDNQRPSVLLEMGYINTSKDFAKITSESYQEAVADDIYRGLTAYFGN
ncbi:N-acetylmuramoyl-L-alanine amidase [Agrilactobacillus fermenti]|uniref:N-acetylmuramoyl-L-alanine amidase n=1 Tax=Agrilactobacillus fermenti TaxID=2586909 RepID=UPI003A5B973F